MSVKELAISPELLTLRRQHLSSSAHDKTPQAGGLSDRKSSRMVLEAASQGWPLPGLPTSPSRGHRPPASFPVPRAAFLLGPSSVPATPAPPLPSEGCCLQQASAGWGCAFGFWEGTAERAHGPHPPCGARGLCAHGPPSTPDAAAAALSLIGLARALSILLIFSENRRSVSLSFPRNDFCLSA